MDYCDFLYMKELDQQATIHTKGCVPQFEKWLQDNLTIVAGVFIGIALLQVSDFRSKLTVAANLTYIKPVQWFRHCLDDKHHHCKGPRLAALLGHLCVLCSMICYFD